MTALNHAAKTPANFLAHTPRNYTITLNPASPYAPNVRRRPHEKEWRKDFGVKFLFLTGEFSVLFAGIFLHLLLLTGATRQ